MIPRRADRSGRWAGFTLVELMVALALAAIISVSIMFISSQARVAYEETVRKVDVYNRFRYAFRNIEEDVKNWLATMELEFYTDGRGRGARVNFHWDPGEEVPDKKDELGPGVVDGGVAGAYDEYAQIVQLQYRSIEPMQTEAKLHDAYQMYFRTFTYVAGSMRLANVEYMLLDPTQVDRSKGGIPAVPKQVEQKNVADLTLYKIVRYYDINPTVIKNLNVTPIVRKVTEVCTNVTDFKVEYMVEKDPTGRRESGFRTPEEEFRNFAEAHVICDQQVDAWHLQATHEWIELVVLDRDPAPERGLEGLHVCVGGSAPSDGVQEGIDSTRFIELTDLRQSGLLEDAGARFQLPNHLELFAQRILVDRRDRHQVLRTRLDAIAAGASQRR